MENHPRAFLGLIFLFLCLIVGSTACFALFYIGFVEDSGVDKTAVTAVFLAASSVLFASTTFVILRSWQKIKAKKL